jgi:uncharacterized protein (DUF885 family)
MNDSAAKDGALMTRIVKLKSFVVVCSLLLCLIPAQAQQSKSSPATESEKLNKLLETAFENYLRLHPVAATGIGDHRYDDQFPNELSDDFRAQENALYSKYLTELSAIDRTALVGQDRLSYDVFKLQSETALEGYKFNSYLTPINQFGDTTSNFAQLASGKSLHPFKTVKNYDDFLGRIRGFQIWVDTAIANMQKGEAMGVVQPRILIEKKLPQIDTLLVSDIK